MKKEIEAYLTLGDKGRTIKPYNMSNWTQDQTTKARFTSFSFKLIDIVKNYE